MDEREDPPIEPALGRQAVRASMVAVTGQVAQVALTTGSTIVLARLLTPRDFGLVAMVAALIGFIGLFKDIGLTQAIVQRERINDDQLSALFWVGLSVAVVLAGLTAGFAPLVARFYTEPDLARITLAYAGFLVITGIGAVHQALLARRLAFARIVTIETSSTAVAVFAAILLGWIGAGYWALIALPGVRATFVSFLMWNASGWKPGRPRRVREVWSMVRFGANITGFNSVNYFARSADNILIGWRWGANPLGLYSRAYALLMLPLRQLNAPLSRVAIPTLSRLQHDEARYRASFLRLVRLVCAISIPAAGFAFVTADWLIPLLLGSGWDGAVPIFRWLALAGLVQPLTNTVGWLFITQDRTAEFFRVGIITSIAIVLSFAIGLPFGPIGVAAAYACTDVLIRSPILIYTAGRRGPVAASDLVRLLPVPIAIAVAFVVFGSGLRMLQPDMGAVAGMLSTFAGGTVVSLAILVATSAGREIIADSRSAMHDLLPKT